jgi:hypothetical protein
MIVEAQHAKAFGCKKRIASRVAPLMARLEVLSAVKLDDEIRSVTDEIHDIGTDGHLPAETRTVHAMGAQGRPYASLGIGRIGAQCART